MGAEAGVGVSAKQKGGLSANCFIRILYFKVSKMRYLKNSFQKNLHASLSVSMACSWSLLISKCERKMRCTFFLMMLKVLVAGGKIKPICVN